MELNFAERLLVNDSARALVQRFYEGPLLQKLGGPVTGLRVLDVGCGRGVGVELLLEQFGAAHVCGVDLDTDRIKRARKQLTTPLSGRFTLAVGDSRLKMRLSTPSLTSEYSTMFLFCKRGQRDSPGSQARGEAVL